MVLWESADVKKEKKKGGVLQRFKKRRILGWF